MDEANRDDLHYQLHRIKHEKETEIAQIRLEYVTTIKSSNEEKEKIEADLLRQLHEAKLAINQMKKEHEKFSIDFEASFSEKLIFEYEKYGKLEDETKEMKKSYEEKISEIEEARKAGEEEIINRLVGKLQEKEIQYQELTEEMAKKDKQHEIIKRQIEEDADKEIYELRAEFTKKLSGKDEETLKVQEELATVKKKIQLAQKEAQEARNKNKAIVAENKKYVARICSLEKEISERKKEISEMDLTLQEKETRIFALKAQKKNFEKVKSLLELKIEDLTNTLQPKEESVKKQKERIEILSEELGNLQKIVLNLNQNLREDREKLKAAEVQVKKEIDKNLRSKKIIEKIKKSIYEASCMEDAGLVMKTVKKMHLRFVLEVDKSAEKEIASEFLRQREFLEGKLRRKSSKKKD